MESNEPPFDPLRGLEQFVPDTHTIVKSLGNGATANVYLYIDKTTLKSPERSMPDNRSQLVAVKVYSNPKSTTASQELDSLQRIFDRSVGTASGKRFQCLMMHDPKYNTWIGSRPILSEMTLHDAVGGFGRGMPPEFVWHTFIELTKGLHFLHQCDPPIVHGDLHLNNIMIDVENPCPKAPRFPHPRLIDFGGQSDHFAADDPEERSTMHDDRLRLYQNLYFIHGRVSCTCNKSSGCSCPAPSQAWLNFGFSLQLEYARGSGRQDYISLRDIWDQYGRAAVADRAAAPVSVLQRIKEVILDVARANIRATEQLIRGTIEEAQE